MEDEEAEDTLSISFVDGISCGLAAALLLFIIFGINISVANNELSENAGQGSISNIRLDLRKSEPTDIVIRVIGPTSLQNSGGWIHANLKPDHSVLDDTAGVTTYIRELPNGILGDSPSGEPNDLLQFSLKWTTLPGGFIDIFRSGIDFRYRFDCDKTLMTLQLVRHFDMKSGEIRGGDCIVKMLNSDG